MRNRTIFSWIFVFTATFANIFAESNAINPIDVGTDSSKPATTALYMVSSKGDYIGQGKALAYLEGQDGHFTIENSSDRIRITFNSSGGFPTTWWNISFTAPEDQVLKPSNYQRAERYSFNAVGVSGLDVSGCGRGCNTLKGEFEVLEIRYNNSGEVESFAANFVQLCDQNKYAPLAPLFGSVRYNSTIPIEAKFSEIFNSDIGSILYLTKLNLITGVKSQPILITGKENIFKFQNLPYGGEGIEIAIQDEKQDLWTLDFAVPVNEDFIVGVYEDADRYPFHSSTYPGIKIITPDGGFAQSQGGFKVKKLIKGKDGEIKSVALNFYVQNTNGEILEGAIRYKSKMPINLDEPYNFFN